MQINTYKNKKEMFPLINPSAVILVIGMLQLSILGNINQEKLYYPIHLQNHPPYIPKQDYRATTGNSNPQRINHQTFLKNNIKGPNRISVFDSSIPANYEASQEDKTKPIQGLSLDTKAAYNDQAEHKNIFDSLVPSEQEEYQDSKNIPVQDLTIPTNNDKSHQNQESNKITIFHSSIQSEQEENQENKIVPVEGLTIDIGKDKSNQNQKSNKISVFDSSNSSEQEESQDNKKIPVVQGHSIGTDTIFESSIPKSSHEDHRKVSVQRLTMDTKQGVNYQAYPKHKLHRISVFDASVQRQQEDVEESKEISLHSPFIPKKDSNKIKPGIDLHHVSISNSSSLRNEKQGKKEGIKDGDKDKDAKDKDGDEIDEESVEEQSFFKTSIRAPYKQANAQDSLNKGLQRISVFDSNILSKNNGEEEVNMQDMHHPDIVQNHRHELQNRRKEFHRMSVFDSTPFSPVSVPAIDQTLLVDRHSYENPEKGLKPISILESSTPNHGKYQAYILDEDIPPKHGPEKHKKQKKTSKKKKGKVVNNSVTKSKYGHKLAHQGENSTVADILKRRVKVLCWIMTCPANHATKARHVKATWGKRCNRLLFMSTKKYSPLPTVSLPVVEGYKYLWAKTKAAFRYIHKHHLNDAEWFLKADDDTYVIVENLRNMLADYQSKDPIYFGFRFKSKHPKQRALSSSRDPSAGAPLLCWCIFIKAQEERRNAFLFGFMSSQGYASGGAGYVLSREALDRFVKVALQSPELCSTKNIGFEDSEMGECLEGIGVQLVDTRDSYDRNRFFPFSPKDHVDSKIDAKHWYWNSIYYLMETGRDCCSEYAISFHTISAPLMYALEYFIYHLRPYGITYKFELPTFPNTKERINQS